MSYQSRGLWKSGKRTCALTAPLAQHMSVLEWVVLPSSLTSQAPASPGLVLPVWPPSSLRCRCSPTSEPPCALVSAQCFPWCLVHNSLGSTWRPGPQLRWAHVWSAVSEWMLGADGKYKTYWIDEPVYLAFIASGRGNQGSLCIWPCVLCQTLN